MRNARIMAMAAIFLIVAEDRVVRADTATAMGDRSGEGSTPFTGLSQAPDANLFTGAATTSIPIMLPPGRKSMTPSLALRYSGSGGPSPFGFGWDLPIGRIERSTKHGVPRCNPAHDDFIMVLPSGVVELVNDGGDNYRPFIEESYLLAKKFSDNHWEAYDRSGMKYVFGNSPGSRLWRGADVFMDVQGGSCRYTAVWALKQIVDPNGNSVDITYTKIVTENVLYPDKVEYGGNVDTELAPLYRVEFVYEPRPVTEPRYHAGVESKLSKRLQTITVKLLGTTPGTIRTYQLTYEDPQDPPPGYRSILEHVAVTGYPEETFAYSESVDGFMGEQTYQPPAGIQDLRIRNSSGEVKQTILDMNGDGFVDLVSRPGGAIAPWTVYRGGPNGFGTVPINWSTASIPDDNNIRNVWGKTDPCDAASGLNCVARDTFDINGDGIPDYVVAGTDTPDPACTSPSRPAWKVYLGTAFNQNGTGGGFAASPIAWCVPDIDPGGSFPSFIRVDVTQPYAFGQTTRTLQDTLDMNADGRPDLVVAGSTSWQVYVNTGGGFVTTPQIFAAPFDSLVESNRVIVAGSDGQGAHHMVADFNGDGLPDLLRPIGGTPEGYDPACGGTPAEKHRCLDVYYNSGHGFSVAPSKVPFWVAGIQGGTYTGPSEDMLETSIDLVDISGDGLPDLVYSESATVWRVALNVGGRFEPFEIIDTHPWPPRIWPGNGPIRRQNDDLTEVDLFDFNGDGMLDQVEVDDSNPMSIRWKVRRNGNVTRPNLLTMIERLGGTTTLRYSPSSTCVGFFGGLVPCDHTGGDGVPDLPIVIWVASGIRENDGHCTPPAGADVFNPAQNPCIGSGKERIAYFVYRDGRFDPPSREFRGFGYVNRISPDLTSTRTKFEQDDEKKGKVEAVLYFADVTETTLVRREYNQWQADPVGSSRFQLWLKETGQETRDLESSFANWLVQRTLNLAVDAAGNVLETLTEGGNGEDQVVTEIEYATPAGGSPQPVYDKPRYTKSSRVSTVFREQWFYYDGDGGQVDGLPFGQVTKGNVRMVKSKVGSNEPEYPRTRMTYDAYGNITAVKDAEGRVSETVYDQYFLHPANEDNALDHRTITLTNYKTGKPSTVVDPNLNHTTYQYDQAGRLECVKRPLTTAPCSVKYTYSYATAPGQLSVVHVDREEPALVPPTVYLRTSTFFDALGRPRETHTTRVVNGVMKTVVADKVEYDNAGRVARRFEAHELTNPPQSSVPKTEYDYHLNGGTWLDPLGRVYEVTAPNGTSRVMTYHGRIRKAFDEENVETRVSLDPYGRVKTEEIHTGTSSPYSTRSFTYDGAGRLLTTKLNNDSATTITNIYDDLGRKTQMSDPSSGTWTYAYDKVGNLIRQNDPKAGQQLQFCYDALNRVRLECPLPNDDPNMQSVGCSSGTPDCPNYSEAVYYFYDWGTVANGKGQLSRVDDSSGITLFEGYDERGRLKKVTKTIDAGAVSTGTTYFEYDLADRVKKVRYPDGEWVETVYDQSGQPKRLVNNAGHIYVDDVRYDLFGRATLVEHGNQVQDERSYYDLPGETDHQRLLRVRTRLSTTNYLNLTYHDYTPRGLIGQIQDARNGSGHVLSNSATYSYDDLGRLEELTNVGAPSSPGPAVETEYEYDDYGRIRQKGARTFLYQNAQKRHWVTGIQNGGPTIPVEHDDNGSSTNVNGGSANYEYDKWNRVKRILVPAGQVEFEYDYTGRRVAKHSITLDVGERTTYYYSDLAEVTSDNQLYKSYYLGGARVASQKKTCSNCQLAGLLPEDAVQLAKVSIERPALVLLVRRDVQVALAVSVTLLGAGLFVSPWRRKRVVAIAIRPGQVILFAIAFTVGTSPWPILIRPAHGQGCGPPTPTPLPTATATPVSAGEYSHYHTDHLGSTQVVTDQNGLIVEQLRYQPYGDLRGRWNGSDPPQTITPGPDYRYEFTTYGTDIYSGLQYAGARFYDPDLGMFLTHDPAAEFASPYTYTNWNPTNLTDPTGEAVEWGLWITIGLYIAGVVAATVDTGVKTGDVGQALKAGLIAAAEGAVGVGTGLNVAAGLTAPQVATRITSYAVAISAVGAGGYGTYQTFANGYYGTGIVAAAATILGAYGIKENLGQGANGAGGGISQEDQLKFNSREFGQRYRLVSTGGVRGFLRTVGGVGIDVLGKLWTLPNTIIGGLVGLGGVPFGARVEFGHNAIQFLDFPLGQAGEGLTLGNVQIFPRGSDPAASFGFYYGSSVPINLGLHEQAHTFQYQVFGPTFLPAYFLSGGISASNPFELAANRYALGGSFFP